MTNKPNMKTIDWREIPVELMEGLHDYSVGLIGVRNGGQAAHCGSGTLVQSGGQHFILTAAHCAEAIVNERKKWERIG